MIFLEIQMSALRGESILLLNLIYSVIWYDYHISLLCSRANQSNSLSICMHLLSSSSVQFSHSHVQLFVTPWTAAHQASLSITSSRSLLKLMSIKGVMPSNHHPLSSPSPPASIFPSIRVFSDVSVLRIRWPEHWTFSFSISPSNEYLGLTLGLTLGTRL